MGWRMSIYDYIHTEIYSLKSYDVNFLSTWIFEPQALSSTNYFSMSILKGSVTSLAWKQAPPWGEKASREVVWGGKRGAPPFPPPQVTPRLISFAEFSYLTSFFAFLRYETWEITFEWQNHSFEKLLGQQVFQSPNWNPFQSSSSLFIPGFFCNCCTFIPSSNCVWAVILKFYLIRYPEYQRFFLACSEELCRPQAEDTSVTETENRARKASCT